MTQMTIRDICKYAYPNQVESGNILFGQNMNDPIFITYWNVNNVNQPTDEELNAMIKNYQSQFDLDYFLSCGKPMLENYIDSIAQQKLYNNAISCISYLNSSVATWKAEAEAFSAWRDSVYNYVIQQESLMKSGLRTIPTFDAFKLELPVILWPT